MNLDFDKKDIRGVKIPDDAFIDVIDDGGTLTNDKHNRDMHPSELSELISQITLL